MENQKHTPENLENVVISILLPRIAGTPKARLIMAMTGTIMDNLGAPFSDAYDYCCSCYEKAHQIASLNN